MQKDIHHHSPKHTPNICHLRDPSHFSLPTTFNLKDSKYLHQLKYCRILNENAKNIHKNIYLLTGVLSKNRKNINDHYHCLISVIILTTSKLEAVLEICCCSLKLSKSGSWYGVGGGGSSLCL
jgi:hypothetical protein